MSWHEVLTLFIVPALGGLWFMHNKLSDGIEETISKITKEFYDYKTEVAKTYVSITSLKDLEDRIMGAMQDLKTNWLRLEDKIDKKGQ